MYFLSLKLQKYLLIEKLPLLDLRFGVRLRGRRGNGDLVDLRFGGLRDRLIRDAKGDLRPKERDLDRL
jgi:hypothetical protein